MEWREESGGEGAQGERGEDRRQVSSEEPVCLQALEGTGWLQGGHGIVPTKGLRPVCVEWTCCAAADLPDRRAVCRGCGDIAGVMGVERVVVMEPWDRVLAVHPCGGSAQSARRSVRWTHKHQFHTHG